MKPADADKDPHDLSEATNLSAAMHARKAHPVGAYTRPISYFKVVPMTITKSRSSLTLWKSASYRVLCCQLPIDKECVYKYYCCCRIVTVLTHEWKIISMQFPEMYSILLYADKIALKREDWDRLKSSTDPQG